MMNAVAASGGKTSDKEQLTPKEIATKDEFLADIFPLTGSSTIIGPQSKYTIPPLSSFCAGDLERIGILRRVLFAPPP
jgi:hypothetical protein